MRIDVTSREPLFTNFPTRNPEAYKNKLYKTIHLYYDDPNEKKIKHIVMKYKEIDESLTIKK